MTSCTKYTNRFRSILSIFVFIFSWSSHLSWSKFSTSPTPFGLCFWKKQSKWYQLVILPSNFADWWNRVDHQLSRSMKSHLLFKIPGKLRRVSVCLEEYWFCILCSSSDHFSHIHWGKEDIQVALMFPSCELIETAKVLQTLTTCVFWFNVRLKTWLSRV